MVLESLVSGTAARKHPITIFFLSLVLSATGIFISYWFFREYATFLSLAFVTIGMAPIIHSIMVFEETAEAEKPGWAPGFIARHWTLIKVYSYFFLGLILSYALLFVVLPEEHGAACETESAGLECMIPEKNIVFKEQQRTWSAITGKAVGTDECKNPETRSIGACTSLIFNNNALVLGLAILFSFMYGAGAIFLIGWNASVIGVFLGKETLEVHWIAGLLKAIGYLPHGIPEIMGYFIGAIAGGIISAAMSKKKYRTHEFGTIAADALVLIILAYGMLFVASLIEAWLIVTA